MIEALLTMPIVLLVFAALIEFGMAVFQFNQAAKASQLGARLAAVSDPLVSDMSTLTDDFAGLDEAEAVPATIVSVNCGTGSTPCDTDRLNRIVYGSDGACDPGAGAAVRGMCDFHPRITPTNVHVSYHRAGLGYVGRPDGAVTTITVEVRDLNFDLPFLGALIGVNSIAIPVLPVTVTSEDLCSAKSC
ncbi:TadE family protein [Marivita geojedonensis]|uniref:TadE family protein n=1 Tax=Marivita geojedonensis TaxID=1123756 RepID=UPI000D4DF45C|nr:TadE family protein [Marivita geojedonensis]PRY72916.1 TadE-like protein [Marivita geojedonensis]